MQSAFRTWRRPASQQARCRCLAARVDGTVRANPEEVKPHTVNVSFKVQYKCAFGQSLAVVGDAVPLGKWTSKRGQQMKWSSGDTWSCNVKLPAGSSVECKYVIVDENGQGVRWQEGSNMALKIPATYRGLPVQGYDVRVSWCKTVSSFSTHPMTTPAAVAGAAAEHLAAFSATPASHTAWPVTSGAQPSDATSSAHHNAAAAAHGFDHQPAGAPAASIAASVSMPESPLLVQPADLLTKVNSTTGGKVAALVQAAASAVLDNPSEAGPNASPPIAADSTTTAGPLRSFQMSMANSDEPMSITIKSQRANSPSVKISLSSSFSKLMEMPSLVRASAGSGCSTAAAVAVAAPAATKATVASVQSHPIDVPTLTSKGSSSKPTNTSPSSAAVHEVAAGVELPAPSSAPAAARNPTGNVAGPAPAAPTWGLEYDVYAAAYGMPYMHTPFDLEAYVMLDQTSDDQGSAGLASSSSSERPGGIAGLASMSRGGDFLETAVQAAHGGGPQGPDSLLSSELLTATAASTALALDAAAATAPNPSPAPTVDTAPVDLYRQVSRSSPSVSDWAGRTLVEMSSGRSVVDEDSDDDETADDDAAVAHALGAPVGPADMAALLKQLGTALGRSVRLRYDGTDATAPDLLELDRKVALAASKLYRQRDGLLTGWVKKETRRQLATAAAPASRPATNSVTPM